MKKGIYDLLVTQSTQEALDRLDNLAVLPQTETIGPDESPHYLARHLAKQVKIALQSFPADERAARQLQLTNDLLSLLGDSATGESVIAPTKKLVAIHAPPTAPSRPSIPLSQSDLLMNAIGQPKLGDELEREMQTADSVLMLVSFIQWRGLRRLRDAFAALALDEKPVRVLTTTYMGASDYRALVTLAELKNVELRISLNGQRRRLHAKAWLFERLSGFSTAYVGSSNLSAPALEDGIEWNVRLSDAETPHNLERFRGAFETLWQDPEFLPFSPDDSEMCLRVQSALVTARGGPSIPDGVPLFFDLKPHAYQQSTLDQLEAERTDRGHYRNLVVAPTGTGKTLIAAFDYARQIGADGLPPRLLFLAHREEILRQARAAFRQVLRDESFGELLAGGNHVQSYDHLFATIQSFESRQLLASHGPKFWHYAVLDEAHHVPAQSYGELIRALDPHILLGLTATPERMDQESILPWFGGHLADEMRLWQAIEHQYLVPFDYYGIYDGVDLSELAWSRGAYQVADLNGRYSGNLQRARLIVSQFSEIYHDWRQARALGFCISVEHAEFMAAHFNTAGIPAVAVTSQSSAELRHRAPQMLRSREVNVLFTVDLYNEGVDIPEVDCLLFLRPTESSTVFLQQMGRGLRLNKDKTSCLILDFIGNQRREFRFDLRYRALFGGTRQQVTNQIDSGATRLPGNCYFRLDKESRRVVLENLQQRLTGNRQRFLSEIRALRDQLKRPPSLAEFLAETQYDLAELYNGSMRGWGSLRAEALGITLPEYAQKLSRQFQHLLHIDSQKRLSLYQDAISGSLPAAVQEGQRREVLMLTFRLLQADSREPGVEWDAALARLRSSPEASAEFLELLRVLRERVRLHVNEVPVHSEWPLYLHRRYTRDEILTAVGYQTLSRRPNHREGRLLLNGSGTEIFFVTLEKNEKHYSPTTRYEDYAVSPTRFHWQSQSTTSETSDTGQRYIEQGAEFLLFVRPTAKEAFTFLGQVRYSSHTGSRPMSIYWELDHPMPASFFERCASLLAA